MNRDRRWSMLLFALSACGAGPVTGDELGSESASATDTSSDSSSDSTSSDSTSSDSTSADTSESTDTGVLECPLAQDRLARFTVTPDVPRTGTCALVDQLSDGADHYEMTLDCAGTPVSVVLDSTILRKPSPAAMVEFDYRTIGSSERWLAIHQLVDQQALVLGGVSASTLDPPGTTLAAFFRSPLLSVADEQPCATTSESCGDTRRLALEVAIKEFGTGPDPVFDQGSWYADFLAFGFAIEVEVATRIEAPNQCDVSDERFELLAVWFASD